MSQVQLAKLWTVLGALLSFYSVNTILVSRGLKPILDLTLLDERPRIESVFALPVCAILMILLCRVGGLYADHREGEQWHARIPVVGFEQIETGSPEGKKYQAFFLFVFLALPFIGLVHFGEQVANASVAPRDGGRVIGALAPVGLWDVLTVAFNIGEDRQTMADGSTKIKGVWWVPIISPVVYLALFMWAMFELLEFGWKVFAGEALKR